MHGPLLESPGRLSLTFSTATSTPGTEVWEPTVPQNSVGSRHIPALPPRSAGSGADQMFQVTKTLNPAEPHKPRGKLCPCQAPSVRQDYSSLNLTACLFFVGFLFPSLLVFFPAFLGVFFRLNCLTNASFSFTSRKCHSPQQLLLERNSSLRPAQSQRGQREPRLPPEPYRSLASPTAEHLHSFICKFQGIFLHSGLHKQAQLAQSSQENPQQSRK